MEATMTETSDAPIPPPQYTRGPTLLDRGARLLPEEWRQANTLQRVMLAIGLISVPWPLAWRRAREITAHIHGFAHVLAMFAVEPITAVVMATALVLVATHVRQRRWSVALWALFLNNSLGVFVLGICVAWVIVAWLVKVISLKWWIDR